MEIRGLLPFAAILAIAMLAVRCHDQELTDKARDAVRQREKLATQQALSELANQYGALDRSIEWYVPIEARNNQWFCRLPALRGL